MKSLKLSLLFLIAGTLMAAALSFNQNIVAIFGGGNPDTGWTTDTDGGGMVLALRAKNRETASTANVDGVYAMPVGLQAPNNNRARWNWELSINSGPVKLNAYDFYVEIDIDPSTGENNLIVNALTFWQDSSYGDSSTLNGQGLEGPSTTYASTSSVMQQSQNIMFYTGSDATLNATYTYTLYAVASGAGQNGVRIATTSIKVVVGIGGQSPPDGDNDGVPDSIDSCPGTATGATVNSQGCSIQDELNLCATGATSHGDYISCITLKLNAMMQAGTITPQQRSAYLRTAAQSNIGK